MNVPNQNSIYVDVKVIDINDNPPVFNQNSYAFSVNETARPGFVVGRLEVMDQDTLSYFNYSISDSTFGIRGIYDQNKIKTHSHYRGSAEIYLNNYLDFNKKRLYDLVVYVSDSQFVNSASVVITVLDEFDKPPRWINTDKLTVFIDEEDIPQGSIVILSAVNDDSLPNEFIFECYSTPQLQADVYFNLNSKTGELKLLKGLDRDLPFGLPEYLLPVSVAYAGNPTLKAFNTVRIVLNDINDNAPYLVYGINNPLIIDEDTSSDSVEILVVDVDTPRNGPPFQFTLDAYTDTFRLTPLACINCNDRERYQLTNQRVLRRNEQKYFIVPYTVKDSGGLSRNGSFQLIVGDFDNNPQSNGTKQIKIIRFGGNIQPNLFMGTLYVTDLDDWDLASKQASNCFQTTGSAFDVRHALQIYGPQSFDNFPRDYMNLQCAVTDSTGSTSVAKVDFSIENVEFADTIDLTAIRLLGITAEELTKKISVVDSSVLEGLLAKVISILGLNGNSDVLKVVTMRNYVKSDTRALANQILQFDNTTFGVDVYFFARQADKLISNRFISQQLYANLNQLANPTFYRSVLILFDTCLNKPTSFCPRNSFCKQNFITASSSLTVDANATSFVGMNNILNAECYCNLEVTQNTCFNGGTLVNSNGGSDYYCKCPGGYEGPRCEFLSITFTYLPSSPSHSYALFKHIELCEPTRIEFEFTTERAKGLLLFNGPINRDSSYFIAVEITNATLLVHIGSTNVSFPNVNVSNRAWHKVDILLSLNLVQVVLDKCFSRVQKINGYSAMIADKLPNDELRLSLGGIPPKISLNHYYYKMLNVFEYEGCIRNVKVNGDLRNLKLRANDFNLAQNEQKCDCIYLDKCDSFAIPGTYKNEFPWWIILVILAALLILGKYITFIALVLFWHLFHESERKKVIYFFQCFFYFP